MSIVNNLGFTSKSKFTLRGLKYVPYVLGWIIGIFQFLLILLMLLVVKSYYKEEKYLNSPSAKYFIYLYGLVWSYTILIFAIIPKIWSLF